MGAKKAPFYRIVAIDSKKHRDGQYIEQIGYYDPTKNPAIVKIDEEIAKKWLNCGAEPTDTVRDLFFNAGIIATTAKNFKKPEAVKAEGAKEAVDAAVKAAKEG